MRDEKAASSMDEEAASCTTMSVLHAQSNRSAQRRMKVPVLSASNHSRRVTLGCLRISETQLKKTEEEDLMTLENFKVSQTTLHVSDSSSEPVDSETVVQG